MTEDKTAARAGGDPDLMAQINEYMIMMRQEYENMSIKQCHDSLVSEYNFQQRRQLPSCGSLGLAVRRGDICYIDFGRTYIQEAGFQHFGLVVAMTLGKAFVIPMTSNPAAYAKAYDEADNDRGRFNLFRLGLVPGLNKPSVLFVNDGKYINTARIITIQAHVDTESPLYKAIIIRLKHCLDLDDAYR